MEEELEKQEQDICLKNFSYTPLNNIEILIIILILIISMINLDGMVFLQEIFYFR